MYTFIQIFHISIQCFQHSQTYETEGRTFCLVISYVAFKFLLDFPETQFNTIPLYLLKRGILAQASKMRFVLATAFVRWMAKAKRVFGWYNRNGINI